MNANSNPVFMIGQNSRGAWIAREQSGRCGGFFISRSAAMKYALLENGNRRDAVIEAPGVFDLDMDTNIIEMQRRSDNNTAH
jgi:hypothetical protein